MRQFLLCLTSNTIHAFYVPEIIEIHLEKGFKTATCMNVKMAAKVSIL